MAKYTEEVHVPQIAVDNRLFNRLRGDLILPASPIFRSHLQNGTKHFKTEQSVLLKHVKPPRRIAITNEGGAEYYTHKYRFVDIYKTHVQERASKIF